MTTILTMTWTCSYIASFSSTLFANNTPATEHVTQKRIRHLDLAFCAGSGAGLADGASDAGADARFSGALVAAGAGAAGAAAGRDMFGRSLATGPVYSGNSWVKRRWRRLYACDCAASRRRSRAETSTEPVVSSSVHMNDKSPINLREHVAGDVHRRHRPCWIPAAGVEITHRRADAGVWLEPAARRLYFDTAVLVASTYGGLKG